MLAYIKRLKSRRALARSLRPNPTYRQNMLAQFTAERRARYWANVEAALHPNEKGEPQ